MMAALRSKGMNWAALAQKLLEVTTRESSRWKCTHRRSRGTELTRTGDAASLKSTCTTRALTSGPEDLKPGL